MNSSGCSKCQAKAKIKKKEKKIKEESDENPDVPVQTVESQFKKHPTTETVNPKIDQSTDSNEDSSAEKKKNKKSILKCRHTSTKKEKGHGIEPFSKAYGVKPPCCTSRSMMYPGPMAAVPMSGRSNSWSFLPMARAPMYGPYSGGEIQPYQAIRGPPMYDGIHISPYPPATAMHSGCQILPYPPMAGAPHSYWQTRPFMETNPMTRYTSYADNYSHWFT